MEYNIMRELNVNEIEQVNGGGTGEAAGAFGAAAGIGAAAFGSSWGSVGVGVAFAVSPIAVGAMVGLSLYAGYQLMKS
jgi:hypothetical protein